MTQSEQLDALCAELKHATYEYERACAREATAIKAYNEASKAANNFQELVLDPAWERIYSQAVAGVHTFRDDLLVVLDPEAGRNRLHSAIIEVNNAREEKATVEAHYNFSRSSLRKFLMEPDFDIRLLWGTRPIPYSS